MIPLTARRRNGGVAWAFSARQIRARSSWTRCGARPPRTGRHDPNRGQQVAMANALQSRNFSRRGAGMKVVGPSALVMMAVLGAGIWQVARAQDATRSFEIYGFAQADYIQDTKRVDPAWQDAFRPSKIATPEGEFGSNGQASVSVKQSRFGVKGVVPTSDHAPPISFKFEFDLFGTGVDAGQTTIRLRHFYGEWGQLLAGQTHSLFMDIDVFPNVIDYWGPPGMVFLRLPQIRWTAYRTANDVFAFAIERPSNDVDPGTLRLVD